MVVDSITEAVADRGGAVIVCGSHGGASVVRYALQARPLLVIFNDAGIGMDQAGIAALAVLQQHRVAACAVSHLSARIGEARSTLETGILSAANPAAAALGARVGLALRAWFGEGLSEGAAGSSPARR